MVQASADIRKIERHYVPTDYQLTTWESLEPFFKDLEERKLESKSDLEKWLRDMNELEAVVSEDVCWRQIRMTCDTENPKLEEEFNYFFLQIQPKLQPYADRLNRKLIGSPFSAELDPRKYFTYLRSVKKSIDLYREANIPILAELSVMQQQYGVISGKMMVEVNGKEYTLQQANKFLENPDRNLREEVYRKIQERRLKDKQTLDDLYTQLIQKRHTVAINAGFKNYRDYKFVEMGRFDYTPENCFQFHEGVKKHVLPLVNKIYEAKKARLGLENIRPWDLDAEPAGIQPLNPFTKGEELLEKTFNCFNRLRPFFGDCLKKMDALKHFDLESRKGKAPGGYNCPLAESGAPFIFMNAAGQMGDVITMVHEGGHAVHSFLAHKLELNSFKEYPMEMAEVASMAMELFSMDYWDSYFQDPADLKRAKEYQLERVLTIIPWIATIDKFQHWIYENPDHSLSQRTQKWVEILNEFAAPVVDQSGLETYRQNHWQKQLHLFEVPFYYIEYGIAQLGAIGMWKQFKENKEIALDNYMNALSLGGTKTLPELYKTAGLPFDFSPDYIKELVAFVLREMETM